MKSYVRCVRWARLVALAALVLTASSHVGLKLALRAYSPVDLARFARPDAGLTVVDRDGAPLRRVRSDGIDRRWIALRDVPQVLVHAVLAAEDRRFYTHDGVDRLASMRAVLQDVIPGGQRSGASTITQQLVKRVYGRPHGVWSKPLEMLRALALEQAFTKEEILEQYLNRLPFGEDIEGVARASEALLGADVRTLSAGQAALLAGIPQAPSAHNPWRHPESARGRRDRVLARMRALGFIDAATLARARSETVGRGSAVVHPYLAPRFSDAAVSAWRAGSLRREGDQLRTTLSLPLQREAERELASTHDLFAPRGGHNAAALVVSVHDGAVLAYVGAVSASQERIGGALDLVRSRRSSGSTLKPFAYGLWFEGGASSGSVLEDVARPITGARGVELELNNYDRAEHGLVTARTALASSYNLAALDVGRRVGADALFARLRSVGLALPGTSAQYGAGLVLGTSVSMWELAQAYLTLARGGATVPLRLGGGLVAQSPRRVSDAASVHMVTDILSDPAVRARAFGSTLEERAGDEPFALKTGTSQRWRDAWAVTYDRRFLVLVWVGDPAGQPMASVSGFEAAAPAAASILGHARATLAGWPAAVLEPVVEETVELCPFTGLRAGPHCGQRVRTRVARGHAPSHALCDQHDHHDGAFLAEAHLRGWVERAHPAGVRIADVHETPVHTPAVLDAAPSVLAPANGTRILVEHAGDVPELVLRANNAGAGPARWFVDGVAVPGASWRPALGEHTVHVERAGVRSAGVTVRVSLGAQGTRVEPGRAFP